jgi:fatty acid desaturase
MDATAARPSKLLTGAMLRELSRTSNAKGLVRLGIHVLFLAFGASLIYAAQATWWLLPAMLLYGWFLVALFAVVHETVHYTAFKSRRLNEIVAWFAAAPSLLNADFYRQYHFAHHRHLQDPERDPELDPPPPDGIGRYLTRIFGLQYWGIRLRVAWAIARGRLDGFWFIPEAQKAGIIRSVRLMLAFDAALLFVPLAFGSLAPLLYWIGPMILAQPILRLILVTEHTGCTMDDNPLTNTRTTLASWPVRLVHWNMHFHAEHHLYPSIPFHALQAAHRLIGDRFRHVSPSYAQGNREIIAGFRRAA